MIARAAARRRIGRDNTWPGFVDALSTLLLAILFVFLVFVLAQFFLGQALSGRDEALQRLHDQVAELGNLLRLERQANTDLRMNIGQLSASLQGANADRDQLTARISELEGRLEGAQGRLGAAQRSSDDASRTVTELEQRYGTTQTALAEERRLTQAARDEVARLNSDIVALRQQLARLEAALDASEAKDAESQAVIADLGRRLNVALASKVEELSGYRSEFYGRLRQVLGDRPDIRVEGDRFVFQAELLFASGSATLGEGGREEMRKLAATLLDIAETIPQDMTWILRIDGHTDPLPIRTARFPSNWELSAARAIAVVTYLTSLGVPPDRLAATGFGPYQPIAAGTDEAANRRNRRIEMRFTQR